LKQLNIPGYYEQWQNMPGHPLKWQNNEGQINHEGRVWIADHVKKTGDSILDVGCGIGLDYDHYKESEIRYLGIDITPKFVDTAKHRGVPAEVGDIRKLRFKDNSFDTVYCKDLLIHLQPGEWRTALEEMIRVARVQIITLEDVWHNETIYALAEKQATYDRQTRSYEMLLFYHNMYSEPDFRKFAILHGLNVQIRHVKMKAPLRSLDGRARASQITVYTKTY